MYKRACLYRAGHKLSITEHLNMQDIISIMGQVEVNITLYMRRSIMALRRARVPHLLLYVRQERIIRNVAKRGCAVNRLRDQPVSPGFSKKILGLDAPHSAPPSRQQAQSLR